MLENFWGMAPLVSSLRLSSYGVICSHLKSKHTGGVTLVSLLVQFKSVRSRDLLVFVQILTE